jgi:alpha-tubulin suppressor-like RCC1 family protein
MATSFSTACAIVQGGSVKCWGSNSYGALGIGTTLPSSLMAVDVPGLTGIKQIAAAVNTFCALTADNKVKCWGQATAGTTGTGTTAQAGLPVDAVGLTNVKTLTGFYNGFCANLMDGTTKCWGDTAANYAKSPATNSIPSETNVPPLSTNAMIAGYNIFYIDKEARVRKAGFNATIVSAPVPVLAQ